MSNNSSLLQVYNRNDLDFISGKGCFLIDSKKQKYLDFSSGIAVNSLGYSHPKLVKTLIDVAKKPWHISNLYQIPSQEKLATKLAKISGLAKVFFCSSGAEAVETSIKIVRKYFNSQKNNKKTEILSFENAFHGRTMGAMSAGGSKSIQEGYQPLLKGFRNIKISDANEKSIEKHLNDKTAAIILEPIQGEGGIFTFDKKFFVTLAKLCKKKNILLILDEIQSGAGRTGKFFAYQHYGITPDIVTVAKGIGAGFPLGACLIKEQIAKVMSKGSHGGTYGGNPLAMAIGNDVVDIINDQKFLANISENSEFLISSLKDLQKRYNNIISEIRGKGLMLGLKINGDHYKLAEILKENKLLTIASRNNIIRLLPPLIISKKEIALALLIIENSLRELS